MTLCSWCMSAEHDREHCPQFAAVSAASAHGIIDPMHDEDPQDQLALRVHRLRAALRGCLADLHALGHSPSDATKELIGGEFVDA